MKSMYSRTPVMYDVCLEVRLQCPLRKLLLSKIFHGIPSECPMGDNTFSSSNFHSGLLLAFQVNKGFGIRRSSRVHHFCIGTANYKSNWASFIRRWFPGLVRQRGPRCAASAEKYAQVASVPNVAVVEAFDGNFRVPYLTSLEAIRKRYLFAGAYSTSFHLGFLAVWIILNRTQY